jgi:TPR repeat protein
VTGEEVALVSLRGVEPAGKPAAQNIAAERAPDPAPSADPPPWAMANYTSDAADKAITPPVLPQPRTAGPPRSVPRVAASPIQPVPAAVAPPPPAPAPAPPPVVTAPPPATPVAVTPLDRDEVNAMLVRARTFLSSGDVAAARVVLRRAAASDDPQAALALGGTYDPSVLKKLGIISFHADPAQAREWYRKAAALGSADASLRLDQLMQTADH